MTDLVPSTFFRFPISRIASVWDDEEDTLPATNGSVTISEDDKNVYVQAALPGVDPSDVEITFDRGIVWIKGETNDEDKGKKYYRKATSSFSYRVAVPGEIDTTVEPEATSKHGVMTVSFAKSPKSQPKKISVKTK